MIFWKFLPRCHFGSVPETLQKMTSAELVVRVTELSGKEFQVGIWIGWWRRKEWTRHEDKLGDLGKLRLLGFGVTNATLDPACFFSGRKVTLNCDETIFALRQKVRTCGNGARRQGWKYCGIRSFQVKSEERKSPFWMTSYGASTLASRLDLIDEIVKGNKIECLTFERLLGRAVTILQQGEWFSSCPLWKLKLLHRADVLKEGALKDLSRSLSTSYI